MMLDPNTQSIWRMWCESTRTWAGSGCVIPCRVVYILSEAAFYAAFLLPLWREQAAGVGGGKELNTLSRLESTHESKPVQIMLYLSVNAF